MVYVNTQHRRAGFLLRLENILDGHRTTAPPEWIGLLFRRVDVGMEIDDHARFFRSGGERPVQVVPRGTVAGESSSSVLPVVSIENNAQLTPAITAKTANIPNTPLTP